MAVEGYNFEGRDAMYDLLGGFMAGSNVIANQSASPACNDMSARLGIGQPLIQSGFSNKPVFEYKGSAPSI